MTRADITLAKNFLQAARTRYAAYPDYSCISNKYYWNGVAFR